MNLAGIFSFLYKLLPVIILIAFGFIAYSIYKKCWRIY